MYLSRRQTLAMVVLVALILLGLAILVRRGAQREGVAIADPNAAAEDGAVAEDAGVGRQIVVHVCGAVKNPGVYTLPAGARIFEAVEMAGGALPEADQEVLNLAAFLRDGEQIRVPRQGEAPAAPAGALSGASGGAGLSSRARKEEAKPAVKFPLDLNRASAAELEEVPGIGPALADRIVDYRGANGAFATLEDLLNVSGIGQKTLDKIRPFLAIP